MAERKDYRLLLKIKNNRILEMIEANGYSSVGQFCVATGLHPSSVGPYVNMKKKPILRTGEWSVTVIKMADALCCSPESLFTEKQKETSLLINTAEIAFEERHLAQITNYTPEQKMIIDETKPIIDEALSKLTEREQSVINLRFGLDGNKQHTFNEVGEVFGVSRERIRQIEAKALSKLRHPSRGLGDHKDQAWFDARNEATD